ncbi:tetratricopeptide repeat-containing sensor histidine kinase [Microbulbifer rhizosphaerae]|uniref:Signal transduction histidine kinase n=1 Tax=Microbulbifer rhizosphaerae TaxID=1562603 RepID=A0A7W4ZA76_9GAMM|nr:tetratricopeptide repeat protein [Microbulbifer rhizosphaerae]MBB3060970.1 signal transduction histidine kinase [Microbulbifer rhizosphaerae]
MSTRQNQRQGGFIQVFLLAILWFYFVSPSPATAGLTDPFIEQRLDDYLQLTHENKNEEAKQFLNTIIADLNEESAISSRVRALSYRILDHLVLERPELAGQEADALLSLARASMQPDAIAEALTTKLRVMSPLEEGEAAESFMAELSQYLAQSQSARIKYIGHNLLGRLHRDNSEYERALTHFNQSLEAVLAIDNQRKVLRWISLNKQIAYIYTDQQNWAEATALLQSTIKMAHEHQGGIELPHLYRLKGYIESMQQQYEQARESGRQALHWARQLDDKTVELIYLNDIGDTYLQTGQYESAGPMLEAALAKARERGNKEVESHALFNLGSLYIRQGDHGRGLPLLEQSVKMLRKNYNKADLQDLLGELAGLYQMAGQYKQQAQALLEQRLLREELFQSERAQRLEELQKRYESKDKAHRILLLERENTNKELQRKVLQQLWLFTLLVGCLLLLSGTAYFLWRLRHSNALLRRLAARLEFVREEERKRIARDIHDDLGQYLTTMRMEISGIRMLCEDKEPAIVDRTRSLNQLIDQTISVSRSIAASLRPAQLDMGGSSALEWLVEEFSKKTGIECQLEVDAEDINLSDKYITAIFRILQESLTNVARHALATRVRVSIRFPGQELEMLIEDNGKGFESGKAKKHSFGLAGMQERALMLGGELVIDSKPGAGTSIRFKVHVPKED